jgi:nitrite reductase/ring-hydroxylating ferredoxin subunit
MNKLTRRDFLKITGRILTITGLAAIFGPVVAYFYPNNLEEVPSEPVKVCAANDLPQGESKIVPFGRYPALVINTNAGLRAYSAVCTHFACICKWEPENNRIVCPCHDGFFDPTDGHVISGPPPTALESLKVEIVNDDIYISPGGEA